MTKEDAIEELFRNHPGPWRSVNHGPEHYWITDKNGKLVFPVSDPAHAELLVRSSVDSDPDHPWADRQTDLDEGIDAEFPTRTRDPGRHERYMRAMELVSARHSKYALVNLVNYLLSRIERLEGGLQADGEGRRQRGGAEDDVQVADHRGHGQGALGDAGVEGRVPGDGGDVQDLVPDGQGPEVGGGAGRGRHDEGGDHVD